MKYITVHTRYIVYIFVLMNLPTILTLLRVLMVPVLIFLCLFQPFSKYITFCLASVIFALASLTDWLDGFIARSWNQITSFGAFLDPVADKILVLSAFVIIAVELQDVLVTLGVLIILSREIIILALRQWFANIEDSSHLKVNLLGKLKTVMQIVTVLLFFFLCAGVDNYSLQMYSYLSLSVTMIVTLISLGVYFYQIYVLKK